MTVQNESPENAGTSSEQRGNLQNAKAAQWLDLASHCEKATGQSDQLDAHILCGIAPKGSYVKMSQINGAWCIYHGVEHRSGRAALWHKPYRRDGWPVTASLDAITALIERELPGEGCILETHSGKAVAGIGASGRFPSRAATPALALCAAFARAMAEKESRS